MATFHAVSSATVSMSDQPAENAPAYTNAIDPETQDQDQETQPLLATVAEPDTYVFALRIILYLLLVAIGAWVLALVVDSFVWLGISAPAGSGFENMFISILSFVLVATSIAFYKHPSPLDRVLGYITIFLLVVDFGLVAFNAELKRRIGIVPGLVSILGSVGVIAVCSCSSLLVQMSDQNQELEQRKGFFAFLSFWFKRFIDSLLRVLILAAVTLFTINLVIDAVDSQVDVLGKLVGTSGYGTSETFSHVSCTPADTKGPLVIVEGGEGSAEEASSWVIQTKNVGSVCYWDRPGFGFSDNGASSQSVGDIVDLLEAALNKTVPDFSNKSVILVSHGVGSLYSRVFAARLGQSVRGLVFVDGSHEESFYDSMSIFTGIKHFFLGLGAPVSFRKLTSVFTGHDSASRVYGREQRIQARHHKAVLQQQVMARRRSRIEISDATYDLTSDIPLLVVSSARSLQSRTWATYQRLLLKLSSNVMAWKVLEGPHELYRNRKALRQLSRLLTEFIAYT